MLPLRQFFGNILDLKKWMMKIDELIRRLKANGWFEERQSGSHKIFKHKTHKETISVPYHKGKEVPTGTANSILKKAGVR